MPTVIPRPAPDEYAAFYAGYVARVPDDRVPQHLAAQIERTAGLLARVTPDREGFRYAEGKWSIREVAGHLADTERIMAYRLLRVARQDATALAGFDENAYVPAGAFEARSLADLTAEFRAVRAATLALLGGLPAGALERRGQASGTPVTARALAYIIAGHELHHVNILETRYGLS